MKREKINLLMALRLLININLLLGGLLWSASGHSQDEAELASLSDAYVYEGNSHFNNSFFLIKTENVKLVCDPWIGEMENTGTWSYPNTVSYTHLRAHET